jgi:hypothetical protein
MTITPLNGRELTRWNRWLYRGYGLREWSGNTVYRCDLDYTLYLTPLFVLPGLGLRREREFDVLLASFEISKGISTIASVWTDSGRFRKKGSISQAEELVRLAAAGQVGWGIESLGDSPFLTSICFVCSRPLIPLEARS